MTLKQNTITSATLITNDREHVNPADQSAPTPPPLLTGRGHSDSALPHCRLVASQTSVAEDASLPLKSSALSDGGRPALVKSGLSTGAPPKANVGLRLPSFQSLGIATPTGHPTALLTPPEESGLPDALTICGSKLHQPRSQSFPQVEMPASPKLAETTIDPTPVESIEDATPRQENVPMAEARDPISTNVPALPIPDVDVSPAAWATEAIRNTGEPIKASIQVSPC